MTTDGSKTILMIDDEVNARKVAKLILEREGYRTLTASNGEEGLILVKVSGRMSSCSTS